MGVVHGVFWSAGSHFYAAFSRTSGRVNPRRPKAPPGAAKSMLRSAEFSTELVENKTHSGHCKLQQKLQSAKQQRPLITVGWWWVGDITKCRVAGYSYVRRLDEVQNRWTQSLWLLQVVWVLKLGPKITKTITAVWLFSLGNHFTHPPSLINLIDIDSFSNYFVLI